MTDQEVITTRNDKEMILRPHLWPWEMMLPVKIPGKTFEPDGTGVIIAGHPTTVYIGIMGLIDFETCPVKRYATVDELLADGWVVD